MVKLLSHKGTQAVIALAGLGLAILAAGGALWSADATAWAIAVFAIGGMPVAFAVVGAVLLVFRPNDERIDEHGQDQHRQDVLEFVALLLTKPYPTFLNDHDSKNRLLRQSLHSHFPNLAGLEQRMEGIRDDWAVARAAIQKRAGQEATASGFEEAGAAEAMERLLSTEADAVARSGRPHFDDKWPMEIRDDRRVWFGAFCLGSWSFDEAGSDPDAAKRRLLAILRQVDDWDEVRKAQEIRPLGNLVQEYDDTLAKISVTHSLPGQCDLCS